MKRWITAVMAPLYLFSLGQASAQELKAPDGLWEIESKDSRYEVTTCGPEAQLCGELVWLGNGADNAKNLPYLNTLLIDHAEKVAPGRWTGQLSLFGQTASGTIRQVSDDQIEIEGCVFLVVCKSYDLYRLE